MTKSDDSMILSVSNVANRLGCAASSVVRWADEGKIPFIRDGNNRRVFRAADVEKFRASHPTDRGLFRRTRLK